MPELTRIEKKILTLRGQVWYQAARINDAQHVIDVAKEEMIHLNGQIEALEQEAKEQAKEAKPTEPVKPETKPE